LQPDIAAVLTSNDGTACKMGVTIQTDIDDDLSIADADLQRHGSLIVLGDAIAESADKATHGTYPSFALASIFMESFECSVVAFYAVAFNARRASTSFLVSL
jgi:hypothetical protein